MKDVFVKNNVETSRYVYVTNTKPLKEEDLEGMRYPLFVKASDSYGSIGCSKDSVVNSFQEVLTQSNKLLQMFTGVLIEEFILGSEYSVLIIGHKDDLIVFPPAQRSFDKSIPIEDQFLSYHLVWEEAGTAYNYISVEQPLSDTIADLARRAYLCLDGNGFGRVDIRRRDSTGEFFVLEVNATCGIGSDSSGGCIVRLAGHRPAYMLEALYERCFFTRPSIQV